MKPYFAISSVFSLMGDFFHVFKTVITFVKVLLILTIGQAQHNLANFQAIFLFSFFSNLKGLGDFVLCRFLLSITDLKKIPKDKRLLNFDTT